MHDRRWLTQLLDARLDWRTLQAFLDVAECGTFRSASIERRFALNTLRWRVADLERLAGCELVRRSNEGITLTPAGEDLLRVIRAMVAAKEEAVTALARKG
jgi:DNA-binding transcriptional LysR family regulator